MVGTSNLGSWNGHDDCRNGTLSSLSCRSERWWISIADSSPLVIHWKYREIPCNHHKISTKSHQTITIFLIVALGKYTVHCGKIHHFSEVNQRTKWAIFNRYPSGKHRKNDGTIHHAFNGRTPELLTGPPSSTQTLNIYQGVYPHWITMKSHEKTIIVKSQEG